MVTCRRVPNLNIELFLLGGLLVAHGVHGVVHGVVVGVVDAADRHSVVDARLVDRRRQRVLRQLQLRGLNQGESRLGVLRAGVLEELPNLLGAARSRLPEFFAPLLERRLGHGGVVGECLLDARANYFFLLDGLNEWVLQVSDSQACVVRRMTCASRATVACA